MAANSNHRTDTRKREWKRIHPDVEVFRPDNGPARDVLNGRRSLVVTGYYSYKTLVHVPCEGHGEEQVARSLDCISVVKHFLGQPETVRFSIDPDVGLETYTPDFGVKFNYGYVRFEYKRLDDLWPPLPDPGDEYGTYRWCEAEKTRAKLRRAREAYRRVRWPWILLTDVELAKTASASVVDELVANFGWPIAEDDLARLRLQLTQCGPLTLGRCEELIRESDFPRGQLWSLIPANVINIDLRRPIDADTQVNLVT